MESRGIKWGPLNLNAVSISVSLFAIVSMCTKLCCVTLTFIVCIMLSNQGTRTTAYVNTTKGK